MNNEIEQILKKLKELGFRPSAIEKELGFSNGLLGKAAKGATKLSETKLAALQVFYVSKTQKKEVKFQPSEGKMDGKENKPIFEVITDPFPSDDEFALLVGRKIMVWCGSNRVNPGNIIEYLTELRSKLDASLASETALKIKLGKKDVFAKEVKVYDSERIKNPKDEYDPFKNPRFNGKIGVKASDKKKNGE